MIFSNIHLSCLDFFNISAKKGKNCFEFVLCVKKLHFATLNITKDHAYYAF